MADQVKYRRGTAAQTAAFTGANGEATIDQTQQVWRIHDGTTAGGIQGARSLSMNTLAGTNETYTAATLWTQTRRSNGGAAMVDTGPTLAALAGVEAGAQIYLANTDASATLTVNAGSGTTWDGGASLVIQAGRGTMYLWDGVSNFQSIQNTRRAVQASIKTVGDAAYQILPTDRTVLSSVTLTTTRTWTLPLAASVLPGDEVLVEDSFGAVSASNTLSIAHAGSDTINGGSVSCIFNSPGSFVRLRSNGVSNWTVAGRSTKITQFLSSGTYTPEPGLKLLEVYLLAGGGAGGGGALQATSTACSGGGGGGGGSMGYGKFQPSQIGASATVTIAAMQTGGLAATSTSTAGGNGSAGNQTSFANASSVNLVIGHGGGGGAGGQLAAAAGGGAGGGSSNGSSSTGSTGGTSTVGGGTGGASGSSGTPGTNPYAGSGGGGSNNGGTGTSGGATYSFAGSGGGGGGGISAGNAAQNGLGGGTSNGIGTPQVAGSAGGTAGGTLPGTNGAAPTANAPLYATGSGGGGGASDLTASGKGGDGGYGCGGGGGGSSQNSHTAAAGGQGGQGVCVVIEYF